MSLLSLITSAFLSSTSSGIPVPSGVDLRYQATDFFALIHFNMATFIEDGDPGCTDNNWNTKASYATGPSGDPATFNPVKLNTTQWFDSINALGASIAVLTAKHGCGFAAWPTKVKLPNGKPFGYDVSAPGAFGRDVLSEFVESAKANGVGYGFYFSMMQSYYLCRQKDPYSPVGFINRCLTKVQPGQYNVTDDEFEQISGQMAAELWSNYGNLSRIWLDSPPGKLIGLLNELQPYAANTYRNPLSWCGTELGNPSASTDFWHLNTLLNVTQAGAVWKYPEFYGSPDGSQWVPGYCDPQITKQHRWFFQPDSGAEPRTLAENIGVYHAVVGKGLIIEMDFSINRDGLVEPSHEKAYKDLGNWVRACYGSPLVSTAGRGSSLTLTVNHGQFDRIQLAEDIVFGQRVRSYTVGWRPAQSTGSYQNLVTANSMGRKRIFLLKQNITAPAELVLSITSSIAEPIVKQFAVFSPCSTGH